ncbi:MAG: hypothetical protein R3F59_31390 [Myxococcota bacterium]
MTAVARFSVAAALGALVGGLAPVAAPVAVDAPLRAPDPVPAAAPCPTGVSRSPESAALEASLAAEEERFSKDWGSPVAPPAGWDAAGTEARVLEALTATGAPLVRVDCSLYPCTGLVAVSEGDGLDARRIAQELDLFDADLETGFVTSEDGAQRLDYVAFSVGSGAAADAAQRQWCRALRKRLVDFEHQSLMRAQASDPEP